MGIGVAIAIAVAAVFAGSAATMALGLGDDPGTTVYVQSPHDEAGPTSDPVIIMAVGFVICMLVFVYFFIIKRKKGE